MTAAEVAERQARATAIESMLDELAEVRRRIYRSKTYGVRAAGLRDAKRDAHTILRRLEAA